MNGLDSPAQGQQIATALRVAFWQSGLSQRALARALGCSEHLLCNALADPPRKNLNVPQIEAALLLLRARRAVEVLPNTHAWRTWCKPTDESAVDCRPLALTAGQVVRLKAALRTGRGCVLTADELIARVEGMARSLAAAADDELRRMSAPAWVRADLKGNHHEGDEIEGVESRRRTG